MSVTLNAVMAAGNNGDTHAVSAATSFSTTGITVAAGSNRLLVVGVHWGGNADNTTTPTSRALTWNGVAMTEAKFQSVTTSAPFEHTGLYTLVNPATGAQTLAGSWTGAVDAYVFAICFDGADQTDGIDETHTVGETDNSIDITGTSDGATVSVNGRNGSVSAIASPYTIFGDFDSFNPGATAAYRIGAVGTNTHDHNNGSNIGTRQVTIGIHVIAATGGGGGTVNTQTLSDTLTVGDASVMSQVRGRFHEDTISAVTDEGVLFYRRNRLLESSIAVTDEALASIVGNNILTKILSSNIDVTDGAVLSIIRKRFLQDTILITEGSTEQYVNTNIVVDDTIDVTDSLLARLIWRRILGDSINITDEALATLVGQNVITKVLTSTLTTFDEALRWMNRFRLGESFVLTTDEVVKVMRFTRELTDTIDAIDQAQTAMQRFILLSDALSVQDDVIASYIPPGGPVTYDPIIRVGFDQPRIDIGGRA